MYHQRKQLISHWGKLFIHLHTRNNGPERTQIHVGCHPCSTTPCSLRIQFIYNTLQSYTYKFMGFNANWFLSDPGEAEKPIDDVLFPLRNQAIYKEPRNHPPHTLKSSETKIFSLIALHICAFSLTIYVVLSAKSTNWDWADMGKSLM